MDLLIENRNYMIHLDNPMGTFIVDYKLIKGDRGPAGSNATVVAHEALYVHSQLHVHSNQTLLDGLSFTIENGIDYQGTNFKSFIPSAQAKRIQYTNTDNQTGWSIVGIDLENCTGGVRIVETRTYNDPGYNPYPAPTGGA